MVIPVYPAFNIYSRTARTTTALGPVCVASVISQMQGWDVEVVDENNYRRFGPRDKRGHPDHATLQAIRHAGFVGLYGGLSSTIPRLHELARQYHEMGAVIIAGGQHFVGGNIRDALENGIDYVVLGEGEQGIAELLETIGNGGDPANICGIAFMRRGELVQTALRPPITDFDALPLPDFRLLRYAKVKIYPVGWIRGCGMDCEFCTVKGAPRAASPERVVEQIAAVLETHGARHFFLVDDLFGHDRPATMMLCEMLTSYQEAVGVRLRITVQIRLDFARDAALLRAMRKAGINAVCIGIESPIAEELAAMGKRLKPGDMVTLARLYHKAGFLVHGMFIFGYPLPAGASMDLPLQDRIRRFRQFIRKSRVDTIQVVLPVPLPGTAMTERLAATGRIFPRSCIGWEYYDGNFPLFMPDAPLMPEDMQQAIRKIMGHFYRFRNMFSIGGNVLIFPAMLFSLWNIPLGWRKWHRLWRNNLIRFSGWIVLRHWISHFSKGSFGEKLNRAKQEVGG